LEAEHWTRELPRVFISFRQLLENWPGTLEKISDGLGINFPVKISDVVDKVSDFLDLEMKHHNRAEDLWSYDPDTPQCVLKAYSDFVNTTDGADKDFVSSLSECRAEFESSMLSYPSRALMEELKQQRARAGTERAGSAERLTEQEGLLQERDARLVEASAQLKARAHKIASMDVRISELEQGLSAKDKELQNLAGSLNERDARIGELDQVVAAKKFEITGLFELMEELERQAGELKNEIKQLSSEKSLEVERFQAELTAREDQAARLEKSAEVLRSHIRNLESQISALQEKADIGSELCISISEKESEIVRLNADLAVKSLEAERFQTDC
jgi:chromosome segregation ATPase